MVGTSRPLIWYLPKLIWVTIFLAIGLSFLTLEKNLFSSQLGQVLLGTFILAILFWFKGALNRYKSWKNWMHGNKRPIKWHNWFRF